MCAAKYSVLDTDDDDDNDNDVCVYVGVCHHNREAAESTGIGHK